MLNQESYFSENRSKREAIISYEKQFRTKYYKRLTLKMFIEILLEANKNHCKHVLLFFEQVD